MQSLFDVIGVFRVGLLFLLQLQLAFLLLLLFLLSLDVKIDFISFGWANFLIPYHEVISMLIFEQFILDVVIIVYSLVLCVFMSEVSTAVIPCLLAND